MVGLNFVALTSMLFILLTLPWLCGLHDCLVGVRVHASPGVAAVWKQNVPRPCMMCAHVASLIAGLAHFPRFGPGCRGPAWKEQPTLCACNERDMSDAEQFIHAEGQEPPTIWHG